MHYATARSHLYCAAAILQLLLDLEASADQACITGLPKPIGYAQMTLLDGESYFVVAPLNHTLSHPVTMPRKHGGILHKLCDRPVPFIINSVKKRKREA